MLILLILNKTTQTAAVRFRRLELNKTVRTLLSPSIHLTFNMLRFIISSSLQNLLIIFLNKTLKASLSLIRFSCFTTGARNRKSSGELTLSLKILKANAKQRNKTQIDF